MTTVGVIGAGRVGASCARAIVRDGLVTRLTIYDRTESYAQGEALDLSHALPMLEPCEIRGRALTAIEPEDVLVMAFGGHTAPGQTRLDLTRANLAICEEVAGHVEVGGLPRVCLVATSPLDVLTEYLTRRWAGRVVNVIGSGTSLDTWRLRGELSSVCRVHPAVGARMGRGRARRLRCAAVQFGKNRRPHTGRVRSADRHRLVRRAAGNDCRHGANCCISSARTQGLDMGRDRTCGRCSGAQHRPRPRANRSRFGPRRRSALRQFAVRARSRGCGQATSPEDGRAGGRCLGAKPRGATSSFDSAPLMSAG